VLGLEEGTEENHTIPDRIFNTPTENETLHTPITVADLLPLH
jgi:hypothetical protein